MNNVYIVCTATHFPEKYSSNYVTNTIYKGHSKKTRKFAARFSRASGIDFRHISVNLDKLPDIVVSEQNHPLNWIKKLTYNLVSEADLPNIGFVSIGYNVSSHENFIPNLSSRACLNLGIRTTTPPLEYLYMGCASGVYSILAAFNYCRENDNLSAVYSLEQSSCLFSSRSKDDESDFIPLLRGHTIFGDGSAGLLLSGGERLALPKKRYKIIDILVDFVPGDEISMRDGKFQVGDEVKNVMPVIISRRIVIPLLKRNGLEVGDILQWSIHQGSHTILSEFEKKDVLGLSPGQTQRSREIFQRYGNISSPSCLAVLDAWFRDPTPQSGEFGVIFGFGAGYYLGAVLYRCM